MALRSQPGRAHAAGAGVLALVAVGRSNQGIADVLIISIKTAAVHVSNILAKRGLAHRGGGVGAPASGRSQTVTGDSRDAVARAVPRVWCERGRIAMS